MRTGQLEFAAQPMLGCIGVAPEGDYSPRSGPAGYWGGNLDYNLIREGATVCCCRYFIRAVCCSLAMDMRCKGMGRAVGVETSLDVEVTVGLRKPRTQQAHHAPVPGPGRDLQLGIRLSL